MLKQLTEYDYFILSQQLWSLSVEDKKFFSPHSFEMANMRSLVIEKGNYFYIFSQNSQNIGYGMIRTFGKYPIPTLGYVIWEEYRGKGYGNKIVAELVSKAYILGFETIKARTNKDN